MNHHEANQSDGHKKKQPTMTNQNQHSKRKALLPRPNHQNTNIKISNPSYNNHDNTNIITRFQKMQEEEEALLLKLAALAMRFNGRLRFADMAVPMQERALRHARALIDATERRRRPNPTLLARSIKREFDSVCGGAWHCVVGKSFGSFVTHAPGGFVYFSVDSFSFLLFKTQVHLVMTKWSS